MDFSIDPNWSPNIVAQLEDLKLEYDVSLHLFCLFLELFANFKIQEGEITHKGYVKRREKILATLTNPPDPFEDSNYDNASIRTGTGSSHVLVSCIQIKILMTS